MYKSLGGFSWTGIFTESVLQHECSAELESPASFVQDLAEGSGMPLIGEETESEFNILESAQNLQNSIMNLKNVIISDIILKLYLNSYLLFVLYLGLHHRSLQRIFGFRHMVELLYLICHIFFGYNLSNIFQQNLKFILPANSLYKAIFILLRTSKVNK